MRRLASRLKIIAHGDGVSDLFVGLHNWLGDERNGKWLVVLDNADDARFLLQQPGKDSSGSGSGGITLQSRRECFPQSSHGSVIITSRRRSTIEDLQMVESEDIVEVKATEEMQALKLLQTRLKSTGDVAEMQQLGAALEYMPLAIVQAAAYIVKHRPTCTVREYLHRLEKSERARTTILSAETRELRRDQGAKNSILLTWQISFEHIHETRRSAANLLSLMSFYNHQGIPMSLLTGYRDETARMTTDYRSSDKDNEAQGSCSQMTSSRKISMLTNDELNLLDDGRHLSEDQVQLSEDERKLCKRDTSNDEAGVPEHEAGLSQGGEEFPDDEDFREDILELKDYLFISEPEPGGTFEMHRLVQVAARAWLQATKTFQQWARRSVRNLDEQLPFGEYENMALCQTLYPHALAFENIKLDDRDARLRWASMLHNAASYAKLQGMAIEAEKLAEKAYKQETLLLGSENEETLLSQFLLASILKDQGRYEEAEAMHRLVLEVQERVLEVKHPSTLTSMNDLALALDYQGRYREAEAMYRQAIDGKIEVLGSRHPETLTSLNNLGSVFAKQGKYEEAESLHRQVLEDRKRVLGQNHPSTLVSAHNLASALSSQGQYEEAEALHRLSLERQREVLGVRHPFTLASLGNLAGVLEDQRKYKEAEAMHREALEVRKEAIGPKHPDTLTSTNDLAVVLKKQGHYTEAEAMYREAWKGKEEVLGAKHPSTLISIWNLASLLSDVGQYDEAMVLYEQASSGFASALGEDHPDYVDCKREMSECLEKMGQGD